MRRLPKLPSSEPDALLTAGAAIRSDAGWCPNLLAQVSAVAGCG